MDAPSRFPDPASAGSLPPAPGDQTLTAAQGAVSSGPLEQTSVATEPAGKPDTERSPLRLVGPYELLEEIARGGMGVVWKARHTTLGRVVALKMMRADSQVPADHSIRFNREMQAAARLSHPHIVPIYEVDQDEDHPYYAMAYLPGGSLDRHMGRFKASPEKAVGLLLQVARAVAYAHSQGVIHRDLKPGNVLLDEKDEPHVSDFGLARFLDSDEALTQTGVVLGTPAYMAPEQAIGRSADIGAGTDVWALGVMLYEMLIGRRPFTGENGESVKMKILTEAPPAPRAVRPDFSRDLEAVILRALEKKPQARYPSAAALADDLEQYLRGQPISGRPTSRDGRRKFLIAAGLGAGAAAAAGAFLLSRRDPDPTKGPKPIVLLGDTGEPSHLRLLVADKQARAIPTPPDKPFSCRGEGLCLFELLPEAPGNQFQLDAEIRLGDGGEQRDAGIFFGHTAYQSGQRIHHSCWTLGYRELPIPSEAIIRTLQGVRMCGWAPHEYFGFPLVLPNPRVHAARGGEPGQWRRLRVRITDEELRAYWGEDELLRAEPLLGLRQRTELLFRDTGIKEATFTPRGAIGIYLFDLQASFRNIVLTPLA